LAAYLALLLQTAISAGTYLFAKRTLAELHPLELAELRFALAAIVYAAILAGTGRRLVPPPGDRLRALALGVVGLPVNQGLFLSGLARSTPAHAAILYALTPACVLAGARLFLGEPISRARLSGILVAFTGAAVLLLERGLAQARGPLVGDLLLLGAVFAWAAYTIGTRPLAQRHGALEPTGWALVGGAIVSAPFAPLFVRAPHALASVSAAAWAGLAFLVIATSVVAYLLWAFALRRLEAARVAVFTNLQPVATAALSYAIFGERIGVGAAVGGLFVLAGVTLAQR
jgi:drug/metabolite transporter (DMT)-like permease